MAATLLPIALSIAEGVYDLVTFGLSLSGVGTTIATTATETATLVSTGITAGVDSAITSVALRESGDFIINKTIENTATKIAKKAIEKTAKKTVRKTTEKAVKKKLSNTIAKNLTKIFAKYGLKSIFIMISFILTLVTAILYYIFHISVTGYISARIKKLIQNKLNRKKIQIETVLYIRISSIILFAINRLNYDPKWKKLNDGSYIRRVPRK